ncbi:MAG: M23 family metallopeptidase [Arcobacteraceae bacterium]|nr:M23 family metallopeptidase [Arcobacteraceae bacterium]
MKDRLIITVSDVKGTKSYNIHQIVKKLAVIFTIVSILLIGGSFWFINFLNKKMDTLKISKEKEIELLVSKEKELLTKNKLHSLSIKDKIKDIKELSSKLDDIEVIIGLKDVPKSDLITRATLAKISSIEKMNMLQVIPNGSPLKKTKVTAKFGYRKHPITKKKQFHRGIDLRAKRKTDVHSTADGVVRYVQPKNKDAFGRVIIVSHNYGFETVYAHLRKTKVKIGNIIKKGDIIALSGNSGRSTGPHLHYEVRYASMVLNPRNFMKWNLKNYETIFNKERRIKWDSLVSLINSQK